MADMSMTEKEMNAGEVYKSVKPTLNYRLYPVFEMVKKLMAMEL
jgi:hypothetical protein